MRAVVVTAPGVASVQDVEPPTAEPGQVVVDVVRVGVCGTDVELFNGDMSYVTSGEQTYPFSIGHEWCGRVSAVGAGVADSWVGRFVTGDTMLGCQHCRRCLSGRQHLCADRYEIGIRHQWPGALAEQLPVPEFALIPLPDTLDPAAGAMVEPGAVAARTIIGADVKTGDRVLILGAGTIGLLVAMMAQAKGADVVAVVEPRASTRDFAAGLGLPAYADAGSVPAEPWDAVIDASSSPAAPGLAVDLVEPGGRVAYVGLAGSPAMVDARKYALKDLTLVGVLSASGALAASAAMYASGAVDPRPLIAATVGLDAVADVLAGHRPAEWGPAPKVHIAPGLPASVS